MKIVMVLAVIFLVGCVEENSDQTPEMTTMCLDGVAYWFNGLNQSQMMSVRIDPVTLHPKLCEK